MTTHTHAHDHTHSHAAPSRDAGFSLLRLSAARRIGFALIAVAALWGGVLWALS